MGNPSNTVALKREAAEAALAYVRDHSLFAVGHGSTVNAFVEALVASRHVLGAVVAASEATERLLRERGIAVVDLAEASRIPVYVDGCDEADPALRLLKGAGGAHTREKLTAMAADTFVCIADESKLVERLGRGPVAVEVDSRALETASEGLRMLGGTPSRRTGERAFSEAGNPVLDVFGLDVAYRPLHLEREIDALPGVIECGIFAARPADVLLLGTGRGARTLHPDDSAAR